MMSRRITEHPVLGSLSRVRQVTIYLDGRKIPAREGETIAAALTAAGVTQFRTTAKRAESRGIFCAIGRCTDCAMTVDGIPNVRTCITTVRDNMQVETQQGLGVWRVDKEQNGRETV